MIGDWGLSALVEVKKPNKGLLGVIIALFLFLLVGCAGTPTPESVGVVSESISGVAQSVGEFSTGIIEVVSEQAIKPFLSDNPVTPDHVEVGFTPKYIPVRIAVNTNGEVLISSSSSIVSDIGVFDVATGKKIISQEENHLLIIQIDDRVAIYKLPSPGSNETFKVDFSDKYAKYRILSFEQEANGNIILTLETLEFNE